MVPEPAICLLVSNVPFSFGTRGLDAGHLLGQHLPSQIGNEMKKINKVCEKCTRSCKQSADVIVVICPEFQKEGKKKSKGKGE